MTTPSKQCRLALEGVNQVVIRQVKQSLARVPDVSFPSAQNETVQLLELPTEKLASVASQLFDILPSGQHFKLQSKHLFVPDFECEDIGIPVNSVGIGLMEDKGKQFTRHYALLPQNNDKCDGPFVINGKHCYHINFQHIFEEISLKLPIQCWEWSDKSKKDLKLNKIMTIKQLYADVANFTVYVVPAAPEFGGFSVTFFIEYMHPPALYTQRMKEGAAVSAPLRCLPWPHRTNIDDFSKELKLSTAMAFETVIKEAQFVRILSQLAVLLPCSISFCHARFEQNNNQNMPLFNVPKDWPFNLKYLVEAVEELGFKGKEAVHALLHNQADKMPDEKLDAELTQLFYKQLQTNDFLNADSIIHPSDLLPVLPSDDFMFVRRIIITPTRILRFPPEPVMGNRVLRRTHPDQFVRVSFRDDNMNTLHDPVSIKFMRDRVMRNIMQKGLELGGEMFRYVGYSNSQLREQSCYFMRAKSNEEVTEFIWNTGTFKLEEGICKVMARFAQFFTQSLHSNVELLPGEFNEIRDYTGGRDQRGKPYCFSDGVGCMSREFASKILRKHHVPYAGCVQFRYRGYKGVLSLDENVPKPYLASFRPSQRKFDTTDDLNEFEVVKWSKPVRVHLNCPHLNILDQEAKSQGCAHRIKKRVLELAQNQVHNIHQSLMDEAHFRRVLEELPIYAPSAKLRGMQLLHEPFFRGMVIAKAVKNLQLLKQKKRIAVPINLGRSMFGIVDTTDSLREGQVFLQYSQSIDEVSDINDTKVVTGPVMVTKHPMCSAGDVRRLEAVNVAALGHLVDVIVFPSNGSRPHPDEMAGSDLDGDEYSVIWDAELLLNHSAPATHYTAPAVTHERVTKQNLMQKSVDFFLDYVGQNLLGVVGNAYLAHSDFFGLGSQTCQALGRKQQLAVDFAKTGVPMEVLSTEWKEGMPPEQSQRLPDYMSKLFKPVYRTDRLLSKVHDLLNKVSDTIDCVWPVEDEKVHVDPEMEVPLWRRMEPAARMHYEKYETKIRAIMSKFGIATEAEMASLCFMKVNSVMGSLDTDFDTMSQINGQMQKLFVEAREQFFRSFNIRRTERETRRYLRQPACLATQITADMRQMAVAYYKVAYEQGQILSFPWVAWEVLLDIRQSKPFVDRFEMALAPVVRQQSFHSRYQYIQNPIIEAVLNVVGPYFISWAKKNELKDGVVFEEVRKVLEGDLPCHEGLNRLLMKLDVADNNPGQLVLWILAALAMDKIDEDVVIDEAHEDCIKLHETAKRTYLALLLRLNPCLPEVVNQPVTSVLPFRGQPYMVEISNFYIEEFTETLKTVSQNMGLFRTAYLVHRAQNAESMEFDKTMRVYVWPCGTPSQMRRLQRALLPIKVSTKNHTSPTEIADEFFVTLAKQLQSLRLYL